MPSIEIDEFVWSYLQRNAEPFVDTPNSVLRRVLSLGDERSRPQSTSDKPETRARASGTERMPTQARSARPPASSTRKAKRTRAPSHALLAEVEYELPILKVLAEAGGRMPTSEAIGAVGGLVAEKLKELDREVVSNGKPRWESRVQFARLLMIKRQELKSNSPRGVWEIGPNGEKRLEQETMHA
jgi:hypothetical protein